MQPTVLKPQGLKSTVSVSWTPSWELPNDCHSAINSFIKHEKSKLQICNIVSGSED